METFLNMIKEPFVWGFAIGLAIAIVAWKSGFSNKRRLTKDVRRLENELRDLQGHLNTQLKINSQGNKKLEEELEELRTRNENLRVSMATLQSKPGRAEVRQFQIVEAAVRQMREQAPGFAPAWEKAIRQAETDIEAGENGLKKLVRKVIPGIGIGAASTAGSSEPEDKD